MFCASIFVMMKIVSVFSGPEWNLETNCHMKRANSLVIRVLTQEVWVQDPSLNHTEHKLELEPPTFQTSALPTRLLAILEKRCLSLSCIFGKRKIIIIKSLDFVLDHNKKKFKSLYFSQNGIVCFWPAVLYMTTLRIRSSADVNWLSSTEVKEAMSVYTSGGSGPKRGNFVSCKINSKHEVLGILALWKFETLGAIS